MPASFLEFYEKSPQSFKKLIKKLINFSIPNVMQSESKILEVSYLLNLKLKALCTVTKLINLFYVHCYYQKEVAVAVIMLMIRQVF